MMLFFNILVYDINRISTRIDMVGNKSISYKTRRSGRKEMSKVNQEQKMLD